ncbi:MAG: phosphoenolpyruvate--protein phosphotransferase [Ghiorsea sp.]
MNAMTSRPRFAGKTIAKSAGVVVGVVKKCQQENKLTPEFNIDEQQVKHEVKRLLLAVEQASQGIACEIQTLKSEQQPNDVVLILEVHRMMLHDPELLGATELLISQEYINVEWALNKTVQRIGEEFDQIKDEYLRSRKADVAHVGQRILSELATDKVYPFDAQPIMVANDFSPSDIVEMWKKGVTGFVAAQGGADSHAMIVARGVGLPGLVGVHGLLDVVEDGDALILDAEQGDWILNPNDDDKQRYQRVQQSLATLQHDLQRFTQQPSTSKSGYTMPLMANLEFAEEATVANSVGADGVGLFRTEFLFMQGETLPDEAMQYAHYKKVVQAMADKPITFRLLDVGADKIAVATALLGLHESENPALGLRGVRLLLHQPALLEVQLRALVQAAQHGNIAILIPMVTQVGEVLAVRKALDDVKQALGVDVDIALGCMIEVPAAALIADALAKVSDFLSIGSNDLMQYSLAVDRADEHVGHLYDAEHPAIKMLITMTVKAAHQHAIPVSLCGELAANPAWTQFFLDIKMTSLSMSSHGVLAVRQQLQSLS